MADIKHALGTVLHELVEGATSLVENRKGELHDLIEELVETLADAVVGDVEDAAEGDGADAAPAKHAKFKAPADGAASA